MPKPSEHSISCSNLESMFPRFSTHRVYQARKVSHVHRNLTMSILLTSWVVWTTYSLPLLVALAHQCANRNREVRNQAISHLQRMILGTTAHIMGEPRTLTQEAEIFNRVIFPLVDELLKQEVTKGDPTGMVEAKVKVSALLCRAFLQLQVQSDSDGDRDIRVIWMQVLDLLDRLISRNKRDALVCT
jgi:brefeldin A-resistance guanine nucleotide exchange factor 1